MLRIFLTFLCTLTFSLMASEPEEHRLYSLILTENAQPKPALTQLLFFLKIPHQDDLKTIVSMTQMRWIQSGKERWNFQQIEEDKKEQLMPFFKQLGLIDAVYASKNEYDFALIHGGFYSRVIKRIEHLIEEYQHGVRFKEVVLLTGQRFLDPNTIEKNLPLQTETEMMLFIWQNISMPDEMRQIPMRLVDAPGQLKEDGSWTRPTTKDTLIEWLKTKPKPGTCLFISCQPFCGYQDSVARSWVPLEFTIESVGCPSEEDLPVAIYLDNLARWLYQEKIRRKY